VWSIGTLFVKNVTCTATCSPPFEVLPGYGGCYAIVKSQLTWSAAQSNCKTLNSNAFMAVLETAAEDTAMINRLKASPDAACIHQQYAIAGQRENPASCSSPFIWKPTATQTIPMPATGFHNFWAGEPNCAGGNEACVCYTTLLMNDVKWNDYPCDTPLCSICEITI